MDYEKFLPLYKNYLKIPERLLHVLYIFMARSIKLKLQTPIFSDKSIYKNLGIFKKGLNNITELDFYIVNGNNILFASFNPLHFLHCSYKKSWSSCYGFSNIRTSTIFFNYLMPGSFIVYLIKTDKNIDEKSTSHPIIYSKNYLDSTKYLGRKFVFNFVIKSDEKIRDIIIFTYKNYGINIQRDIIDAFIKILKYQVWMSVEYRDIIRNSLLTLIPLSKHGIFSGDLYYFDPLEYAIIDNIDETETFIYDKYYDEIEMEIEFQDLKIESMINNLKDENHFHVLNPYMYANTDKLKHIFALFKEMIQSDEDAELILEDNEDDDILDIFNNDKKFKDHIIYALLKEIVKDEFIFIYENNKDETSSN